MANAILSDVLDIAKNSVSVKTPSSSKGGGVLTLTNNIIGDYMDCLV